MDGLSLYLKCTAETFQKQLAFSEESFAGWKGAAGTLLSRAWF